MSKDTGIENTVAVVDELKETAAEKKVQRRRVFRVENPPTYESLYVVNRRKMGDEPPVCISIKPNAAQQYVIPEDAPFYEDWVKSLRKHEKDGKLKEVAASQEGVPYIPPIQQKIKALEDELKNLRLQL